MEFFRNPEIRRNIIFYFFITAVAVVVGYLIELKFAVFAAVTGVLFSVGHMLTDYFRYKKISELSFEINKILHGKDTFDFDRYAEGELAILENQIFKLTVQLREQASALKKDKVYLTDSIADISHQIKTPLTSINLITSLLTEPDITNERRMNLTSELMGMLSHVEWLISTLLKLSKFDSGTVALQRERVSVSQLIKMASDTIAISMDLRNQKFITKIQPKASFTGDLAWSTEAIENILKNCMEHTPEGGQIEVSSEENALFTEIIIRDNGCGIEREDLPHLFERFYKGKNSDSQSVGIGLALANMIIGGQNGTIKAENNKDDGAAFIIRFYKSVI